MDCKDLSSRGNTTGKSTGGSCIGGKRRNREKSGIWSEPHSILALISIAVIPHLLFRVVINKEINSCSITIYNEAKMLVNRYVNVDKCNDNATPPATC